MTQGESSGLVVIGDNSCSRGHGFESRHHTHFCIALLSKLYCLFENKRKRGRVSPFLKIANDWIQTSNPRFLNQLLYHLCHNHCPLIVT